MLKYKGGTNPDLMPDKAHPILAQSAKFSGMCYFFDSPAAASGALRAVAPMLYEEDEFFLVPVDAASAVLAHFGTASANELDAAGISAFYVPFVSPGRAGEL